MIRSRDLILFVVAILFLGIAMFATLAHKMTSSSVSPTQQVTFVNSDEVELSAYSESTAPDRASEVQRLREKLATQQTVVEAVPSVEGPDDDQQRVTTQADGEILQCPSSENTLAYAKGWPIKDIQIATQGNMRVVLHTILSEVPVSASSGASTSIPSLQEQSKTLLQLPLSPVKSTQPACVPGDIIGVTTSGSLMFNSDARLYTNRSANELLGYARDGFPIYGAYQGQTDECGGYQTANGYRYSIATDRDYIIGCFQASVVPLD